MRVAGSGGHDLRQASSRVKLWYSGRYGLLHVLECLWLLKKKAPNERSCIWEPECQKCLLRRIRSHMVTGMMLFDISWHRLPGFAKAVSRFGTETDEMRKRQPCDTQWAFTSNKRPHCVCVMLQCLLVPVVALSDWDNTFRGTWTKRLLARRVSSESAHPLATPPLLCYNRYSFALFLRIFDHVGPDGRWWRPWTRPRYTCAWIYRHSFILSYKFNNLVLVTC